MTKAELQKKIKALGKISDKQQNAVICSLIGHSNIVNTFFGYIYCGRCEAQIGDSLGSVYDNPDVVIQGHKCDKCIENFKRTTWKDKLFVKDPMVDNPFFSEEDKREFLLTF